jgi:hypothetical protein
MAPKITVETVPEYDDDEDDVEDPHNAAGHLGQITQHSQSTETRAASKADEDDDESADNTKMSPVELNGRTMPFDELLDTFLSRKTSNQRAWNAIFASWDDIEEIGIAQEDTRGSHRKNSNSQEIKPKSSTAANQTIRLRRPSNSLDPPPPATHLDGAGEKSSQSSGTAKATNRQHQKASHNRSTQIAYNRSRKVSYNRSNQRRQTSIINPTTGHKQSHTDHTLLHGPYHTQRGRRYTGR